MRKGVLFNSIAPQELREMSYKANLQSLESQLHQSLESDTAVQIASNGVFAGSFVDTDYPSSDLRNVKNILLEYEPGQPTEIPVIDGKPYLGIGMEVGATFTTDDFDEMVNSLWEEARGYSARELVTRIKSGYGDVQTVTDIVDLVGVSAGAAYYKASQALLFPELERTYRVDDDLELFFFETDRRHYIYLNAMDLADYGTTLAGANEVATYLDAQ